MRFFSYTNIVGQCATHFLEMSWKKATYLFNISWVFFKFKNVGLFATELLANNIVETV